MNENINNLLEEIKYSYTAMQMWIYLDFCIKVDNEVDKILSKLLEIKQDINFDNWKKYLLRNDYIKNGIESSINSKLSFWILWEMSIIQSFSYITSNFKELIDNEESFKKILKELFIKKQYNCDTFYSVLNLIRSISTHWSISKNYKLKDWDFSDWKKYHIKNWIYKLDLNLNIVDWLHRLDLSIDINKIEVWYKFSEIFWGYEMFMFIELCMNTLYYYEQNKK